MFRITAHLLLFFIVFTHSAIAMDVHVPHASGQDTVILAGDNHTGDSASPVSGDFQDCGDLGGHCSHSSTHISGIASRVILPSLETGTVLHAIFDNRLHSYSQTPPLRPPKA